MKAFAQRQTGATLIEVLVAVVVTLLGTLGMIGMQMKMYSAESESYQRGQAAVLLQDMAARITANGANADNYVADDLGLGASEVCNAADPTAEWDLCDWGNLLRGDAEKLDDQSIGAMIGARACITEPEDNLYVVTVVWQGTVETAAPAEVCGQGEYGDEDLRRALSTVVRIPDLDA